MSKQAKKNKNPAIRGKQCKIWVSVKFQENKNFQLKDDDLLHYALKELFEECSRKDDMKPNIQKEIYFQKACFPEKNQCTYLGYIILMNRNGEKREFWDDIIELKRIIDDYTIDIRTEPAQFKNGSSRNTIIQNSFYCWSLENNLLQQDIIFSNNKVRNAANLYIKPEELREMPMIYKLGMIDANANEPTTTTRDEFFFMDGLEDRINLIQKLLRLIASKFPWLADTSLKNHDKKDPWYIIAEKLQTELKKFVNYKKVAEGATWEDFFEGSIGYDLSELPKGLCKVKVTYRTGKEENTWLKTIGRKFTYVYSEGEWIYTGMQSFSNDVRAAITCKDGFKLYKDVDMENCHLALLNELAGILQEKQGLKIDFPELKELVKDREGFIKKVQSAYTQRVESFDEKVFTDKTRRDEMLTTLFGPENYDQSEDILSKYIDQAEDKSKNADLFSSEQKRDDSESTQGSDKQVPEADCPRDSVKRLILALLFGGHIGLAWFIFGLVFKFCKNCTLCKAKMKEHKVRKFNKKKPKGKKSSRISSNAASALEPIDAESTILSTNDDEKPPEPREECKNSWEVRESLQKIYKEAKNFRGLFFSNKIFPIDQSIVMQKFPKKIYSDNDIENMLKESDSFKDRWVEMTSEEQKKEIEKKRRNKEKAYYRKLFCKMLSHVLIKWEQIIMQEYIKLAEANGYKVDCVIHDGLLLRNNKLDKDPELELFPKLYQGIKDFICFNLKVEKGFKLQLKIKEFNPTDSEVKLQGLCQKLNSLTMNQVLINARILKKPQKITKDLKKMQKAAKFNKNYNPIFNPSDFSEMPVGQNYTNSLGNFVGNRSGYLSPQFIALRREFEQLQRLRDNDKMEIEQLKRRQHQIEENHRMEIEQLKRLRDNDNEKTEQLEEKVLKLSEKIYELLQKRPPSTTSLEDISEGSADGSPEREQKNPKKPSHKVSKKKKT